MRHESGKVIQKLVELMRDQDGDVRYAGVEALSKLAEQGRAPMISYPSTADLYSKRNCATRLRMGYHSS